MGTSSASREIFFTNIDQILDIVLDNDNKSGYDLVIGGSGIDNNSGDSEFEYEYEPLPEIKSQQARIQHLESTPQHVKIPLLNIPTLKIMIMKLVTLIVKITRQIQVDDKHFLMATVPLEVMSTHKIIKELNLNLKSNTNPQIATTVTLLGLQ